MTEIYMKKFLIDLNLRDYHAAIVAAGLLLLLTQIPTAAWDELNYPNAKNHRQLTSVDSSDGCCC